MGYVNAETGYEHTSFYFNVASEALNKTLALFSKMMVEPNFAMDRLKMDVDVVDQEFRDLQRNDKERLNKAFRATGNQNHPYTGFFGGNNASLLSQGYAKLQTELQTFHKTKYSSHCMRMVVLGSGKPNITIQPFQLPLVNWSRQSSPSSANYPRDLTKAARMEAQWKYRAPPLS
ncbi:metalloprotease [Entomophthora muscae]|uniref:Metalloprotease n=2 Tax=Entomophthora muscae TaxID=34485 RepID=A0ACC2TBX5_9FUNG|nr:metalloprotease [Entomophthora muscae]KAJ9088103.1 metalloprotease [Entomophthora muscae]